MKAVSKLSPKEAYEKIQADKGVLFLDVRSCVEYKFVGHPLEVILLPWMDEPEWDVNPRFCHAVSTLLANRPSSLEVEIILICRSGNRSLEAGNALIKKGFKNVSHITTGFEGTLDALTQRGNLDGWRYDDLPWEQG
ncbi:rhodanese domain-containing protein [Bathymodiolus thermophilus thioautotrophic gill symbiont]|uniref:Rhodanese domain-containing protein n=1 Tax=Bathymodiolus thermophilus thioautotrophic gill symbiont TaxID=2360 RepID=A0A3G3IPH8_9GAMM|nr:rhodanese-like domain-containing protein [Bathymodiolus thermophilus thioautotrophic gill symbiont]AYQ57690.1 rhodanese domain-containing protein [Bathymodiolus thermophilus thioautotrophic gill symbiont]